MLPLISRLIFLITVLLAAKAGLAQTRLYLIPTVHGMHQQNTRYSYDSIRAMVQRIGPDVIAVEIRPEDEAADTAYLKQNYPMEMWMMRYWQPATPIAGFDWLGEELEGKPIPTNYWKEQSTVKAMQRALSEDTAYQQKLKACMLYTSQRMPALQHGSVQDILKSDAILVRAYYECLGRQLQGSPYSALTTFYLRRNQHIQQRMLSIIRNHPGKTIVALTGADHYPYLLAALRNEPGVKVLQP